MRITGIFIQPHNSDTSCHLFFLDQHVINIFPRPSSLQDASHQALGSAASTRGEYENPAHQSQTAIIIFFRNVYSWRWGSLVNTHCKLRSTEAWRVLLCGSGAAVSLSVRVILISTATDRRQGEQTSSMRSSQSEDYRWEKMKEKNPVWIMVWRHKEGVSIQEREPLQQAVATFNLLHAQMHRFNH